MPLFKRKSKHSDDPRMTREKDNLTDMNRTEHHDHTTTHPEHNLLHKDTIQHQGMALPDQQYEATMQGHGHGHGIAGAGAPSGSAGATGVGSGGMERSYHPGDYDPTPHKGSATKSAGAAVGSIALKEQAMAKEREAEVLSAQSQALAEAERLEQAALEHRERAVADGAHPANKELGAGLRHALDGKSTGF